MEMEEKINRVIHQHEASGKYAQLDNIRLFYLDEGSGEAVLCIHGVPTSSFLYRKIVKGIARHGMRGVALDLPGLGFSDRPTDYEYLFSNFANICQRLLDHLGIDRFHLVIHDIGAPVGLALAAQNRARVKSLTVLNSMLDIENFVKPLPMRPFGVPVLGEAELATLNHTTWKLLLKYSGLENVDSVPEEELDAHIDILKRNDGGDAFLKIMRNFEQTPEFSQLCYSAVHGVPYPIQLIWGKNDHFLDFETHGNHFLEAAPTARAYQLDSKHFLQEEFPEFIADKVADLARTAQGQDHQL